MQRASEIISELSSEPFEALEAGRAVRTDQWGGYNNLENLGCVREIAGKDADVGDKLQHCCNRVASLIKRWLLGTEKIEKYSAMILTVEECSPSRTRFPRHAIQRRKIPAYRPTLSSLANPGSRLRKHRAFRMDRTGYASCLRKRLAVTIRQVQASELPTEVVDLRRADFHTVLSSSGPT
jgi:hypothetical protein